MSASPFSCSCDSPGLCPVFQRKLVGRSYEICQGTDIDPELREKYLVKWRDPLPERVRDQLTLIYTREISCTARGAIVGYEDCGCIEPQAIYECRHPETEHAVCVFNRKASAAGQNICRECTLRVTTAAAVQTSHHPGEWASGARSSH